MLRMAIVAALIGIMAGPADAAERVRIESARYQVGPLQQRLARERGETMARPAEIVDGYLTKPEGSGPFPAIVHLHGCTGLRQAFRDGTDLRSWSTQLAAWGYVVLAVDSFTTRGIGNTCHGGPAPRVPDAYGALSYLARQPFVDPSRVALMGFSAGGIATLSAVGVRDFDLFENERRFKAAIAFYPLCRTDNSFAIPTLILIGDADDWTPASYCRDMMTKRHPDAPVKLIVYPGAHHSFDAPFMRPGQTTFGHRTEYNAAAAEAATEEVRRFLADHLAR